jgi:SpoIID/LytB domain protein
MKFINLSNSTMTRFNNWFPQAKIFRQLPLLLTLSLVFPAYPLQAREIKVGIVQRFGDELEDEMTITSTKGDSLQLKFVDPNTKKNINLTTNEIKLIIKPIPLSERVIEERLILGDHATFETAEDNANRWRELGIEVEVTQPERWQVWAKRSVYNTPLLKRLLINSLKEQGYEEVYLESAILGEKPEIAFQVSNNSYVVNDLEIKTNKNLVQVKEGKEGTVKLYGGRLVIQPNAYGNYTLVNQVDIETYLRGVVPHEIGSNAPKAAAEAQTIIARTYALRNTRRFQADNYELCATTHCQVYYGLGTTSPISDQAIKTTKGLVLTYNNELVDALYSSTTGGITASFNDIWNGEERPYLKSVIDSPQKVWNLDQYSLNSEANFRRFIGLKSGFNETGRKVFRWNKKSTLADLTKDLQKYLEKTKHPLASFQKIKKMEITKRSSSGRILKLEVETDLGKIELAKTEVRSAFSPPISTLFYLEPIYDQNNQLTGYAFIGGGFGHGVGLSQYGSYNLAKLGWSAQKILEFYYPGAKLQPLSDTIVFWQR